MTKHLSETQRRAQILLSARAVFIERGYLAARVQDIAKRAGLSKGAVYFYFSSKRELFMSLVEEEHEMTYSFLDKAQSDPRPAAVKLMDLGQQYLKYFAGLKSPPRFFMMMCELGIRDPEIQAQLQKIHDRFIESITIIINEGIKDGTFRNLDPLAVAQLLKAIVDGLAGQSAVGFRPDRERLSTDGIRMLLSGLLARETT